MIWPIPIDTKNAIRLAWTKLMGAPRLWPMDGRAGRYISIAKGPIADSRPSTRTVLKKDVCMEDEELDVTLLEAEDRHYLEIISVLILHPSLVMIDDLRRTMTT